MIITNLFQILIGFSGGLAVGCGFVAFLTVLGVIPRLIQISKTYHLIKIFSTCVILGALIGTFMSFANINWSQPILLLIIWGLFHGIFNGMLAAALTEVLNVFPLVTKRIGLERYLLWFLMAIVFGKIVGSLFQWVIFVRY